MQLGSVNTGAPLEQVSKPVQAKVEGAADMKAKTPDVAPEQAQNDNQNQVDFLA